MLFFSSNTRVEEHDAINDRLGVPIIKQYDKYLGLPWLIGRSKKQMFQGIKERVWLKLKGWKEKTQSQAGREVLINAVAQAISAYVMSCFRLSASLCNEMNSMISSFWWGQKGKKGKSTGLNGRVYVSLKPMEAWVFET